MTATLTASGRDLRTLAGIVSEDRGEPPAYGLAPSLLSDLLGLIRCDGLSLVGMDTAQQADLFMQGAPLEPGDDCEETEEDSAPFWQHYWDSPCCSYPDRTGDLRGITKISDFYSARQWHNAGMHRDYLRMEHEIMVCLPAGPRWASDSGRRPGGPSVRLLFFRESGPDFSERDRALLTLLRPHLHQAYLDAERRRRGTPQLTPRHWELLQLVAAGHTNSQIARRLGVTEATVRKHLENIYARLHVSSRTAAVTRAFPDLGASLQQSFERRTTG
jgi:DNA-binding CsgD family transcriptional regulator